MKKRKQHYIWRHYLRAWSKNEQINCLRDKKIFKTNLENIGNERDFYKLEKLTDNDIDFLDKLYFQNVRPEYLKYLKNWIPTFNQIFKIQEIVSSNKVQRPELNETIEQVRNNMLEDFHAEIENGAVSMLKSLRKEGIKVFDDEKTFDNFIYFLCIQYFRTKKMREAISKIQSAAVYPQIIKTWKVCSIIYATSAALSLFSLKDKLRFVLLKSTKGNIVTGDQPVINTFADYKTEKLLQKDEIELYYPLSPCLALLITLSEKYKKFDNKILSEISVIHYNNQIFYAAQDQIYASHKEILNDFLIIP